LTLIVVGIAISSLAAALTALAMNLAPNPYSLREMIMWLMGSLTNRSMADIYLAGPFILIGWALILPTGRALQALVLGEETAISLGTNLKSVRTRIVIGVALSVGAGVAVSGAIGFIGLVVPHMIRPFVGHEPGRTLMPSAIGGALLLTLADILTRLMPVASDIRLGVITALLGAPLFLWLIIKTRGEMR
jgi:iron complex transport system permease protein